MTDTNLVEIFCILDEFCKCFTPELKRKQLDTLQLVYPVVVCLCRDGCSYFFRSDPCRHQNLLPFRDP